MITSEAEAAGEAVTWPWSMGEAGGKGPAQSMTEPVCLWGESTWGQQRDLESPAQIQDPKELLQERRLP